MSPRANALTILTILVIFLGRLVVPGHDLSPAGTYEAMTHIVLGLLLGGATVTLLDDYGIRFHLDWVVVTYVLVFAVTLFEVWAFLNRGS